METYIPEHRKHQLRQLAAARGHEHTVVLGPFGQRGGPPEYTVALYDATGRVHRETLRGTYEHLAALLRATEGGA